MNQDLEREIQGYSVVISSVLHSRIAKHLFMLKRLFPPGKRKHEWITAAIKEKLEREVAGSKVERRIRINFRMDPLTKKRLDERVHFTRKFRNSFSKKQLIVDAIQEQLELEEEKTKLRYLQRTATLSQQH